MLAVHGAEAPQHLSCPLSAAHGAERRTPPVPDRYPRCCTKYSSHSPLAVYGAEPSAPLLFPCSLPTMLPPHCHSLSMVLNPVLLPSSLTTVHDPEPHTAPIPLSLSTVLKPIQLPFPVRGPCCRTLSTSSLSLPAVHGAEPPQQLSSRSLSMLPNPLQTPLRFLSISPVLYPLFTVLNPVQLPFPFLARCPWC